MFSKLEKYRSEIRTSCAPLRPFSSQQLIACSVALASAREPNSLTTPIIRESPKRLRMTSTSFSEVLELGQGHEMIVKES